MKPPFEITNKIIDLIASISTSLGKFEVSTLQMPKPKLRKQNKIKTIQATLAIEGNTLTLDQVTAVIEGKRVLGHESEILEVKNALKLYDEIQNLNDHSINNFLKAHKLLMSGLTKRPGNFRDKNVGVLKGTKVSHLAPGPGLVPELVQNLFKWLEDTDTHFLIKSCVTHYEVEFIHPFEDGNGRMGRFWQTLILAKNDSIFRFIPMESLIKENQKKYYDILEACDKAGDSTAFIEFMLSLISESLIDYSSSITGVTVSGRDRIFFAKEKFTNSTFSRKNYMGLFKTISSATASRDLKEAMENGILKSSGNANQTKYNF